MYTKPLNMIFPNHLKRKRGSKHNTARYCQHILIPWRCVCSLRAIGCLYIAMLSLQTRSVSPFGRVHPLIPRSPQFSHVIHKPGDFMHRNEKKWHKKKKPNLDSDHSKKLPQCKSDGFKSWATPAYITQMKTSKSQKIRGNQGTLHELRVSASTPARC